MKIIDKLIKSVRTCFDGVQDPRSENSTYTFSNLLNMGFAMFHLKDPTLSAYKEQYDVRSDNLRRVYGVEHLVGDTAFREGVDKLIPKKLQKLFKPFLALLFALGVMQKRRVLGGRYTVVSVDGTGHYCSGSKQCEQCMVKNHRNGKVSYYHQLLGAVAVHPNEATVFPVACEAIVKQDGSTKNDCELNASKRIIPQIREALGEDEPIVAVFDALYINGPHIEALKEKNINFIIGTKGQTYLDLQIKRLRENNQLQQCTWETNEICGVAYFANELILNGTHQDILVNYFEFTETDKQTGECTFYSTWATDIEITHENVRELVSVARSRWKIENETFNTLKNQGYHLEHNYGHGKQYLSTNFAILTFLAFMIDQIAQHLDEDFQAAKRTCQTFKALWERIRAIFYVLPTMSMSAVYRFIVKKEQAKIPPLI